MKLRISILLFIVAFVQPLAAQVSSIGPNDNINAHKDPIPYTPFPIVHPTSKQPILPTTWLRLPNGKRLQAKDYYSQLNQIEQQLNQTGFSLRNDDPVQIIAMMTNNSELASELQKYDVLIRDFDERYMKYARDPSLIRKEIEQELRNQAKKAIEELYAEAAKNFIDPNLIVIEPIDDYMVQKVNNNLYTAWARDWGFSAGNTSIGAEANISARLGVESNAYQLIGEAAVSGNLLGQNLKLASLGANLEGYAKPKGPNELPPGNYLDFNMQIVGLDRFVKVYDLSKETFDFNELVDSAKESIGLGTIIPNRPTPNFGKPLNHYLAGNEHKFRFSIGPIPCSATIGYAGSIGFDTKIVSKFSGAKFDKGSEGITKLPAAITYSGSLNSGPAIYAEVYGDGAADIEVARAGFDASVVVIDTGIDIGIGAKLNLDSRSLEPAVELTMASNYYMLALNGRAAGFAEAYVPSGKLPPFELKRWEHVIFDWPGYSRRGVLFNVTRRITPHGETILGAPTNDDVANINIMESITTRFQQVVNDLNSNTQDKVEAGNQLVRDSNVAQTAYFNWVSSLSKP